MLDKKIIFVIDDYYGHGGHVKSFVSQLQTIETEFKDITIVCAEGGYIQNNIDVFSVINNTHLRLVRLNKIRRWQFSYTLYASIRRELSEGAFIHVYSSECYFSALTAKSFFKEITIINSVMGGPNPFPLLGSTNLYIAVSKEQKDYAIENGYYKNFGEKNIVVIKNRIKMIQNKTVYENKKIALVVSRFDSGMTPSLNRIVDILKKLPSNINVLVAGTGNVEEEYRDKFKHFTNIDFLGFCDDLNVYRSKAFVVLGMGRSILESLLLGKSSILVGYAGIELLDNINNVKFAADYNFSGRSIQKNVSLDLCVDKIISYHKNDINLGNDITSFLQDEYSITRFKGKYLKILKNIKNSDVTKVQILKEYLYILSIRVKRKLKR